MDEEDQAGGGYTDEDIRGRTLMGRFARPEEIAQAVAFLANQPNVPWAVRSRAILCPQILLCSAPHRNP